jgi:hypothetical protein
MTRYARVHLPRWHLVAGVGMLTLIAGPVIALLPRAWRERFALTFAEWKVAGTISGILESFAALAALVAWYSYSVTHWAQTAISSTVEAHPQAAIPPGTEGFAALALLLFHPLTWFIFYCGVEGTVRLLAAGINGTIFGILPLYLLERGYAFLWARRNQPNASGDDLLTTRTDAEGEILEIRSLKPKDGWLPPKIVRFRGAYYSLFHTYEERAEHRYFVFVLRRLSAGVPGWTVINYSANIRWVAPDEPKSNT